MQPVYPEGGTGIPGTEEAIQPFFSPDGDSIGFFSGGKLKRVSLAGEAPLALADASNPYGGDWGPRDTIVFAPDHSGLFEVAAGGGQGRQLTKVSGEDFLHARPAFLAGGEAARR